MPCDWCRGACWRRLPSRRRKGRRAKTHDRKTVSGAEAMESDVDLAVVVAAVEVVAAVGAVVAMDRSSTRGRC